MGIRDGAVFHSKSISSDVTALGADGPILSSSTKIACTEFGATGQRKVLGEFSISAGCNATKSTLAVSSRAFSHGRNYFVSKILPALWLFFPGMCFCGDRFAF